MTPENQGITNTINELLSRADKCGTVTNKDFTSIVNLIAMVSSEKGSGETYNTLIQESYKGNSEDVEVSYPVDTYHSISICVMRGTIVYGGFTFYEGTVRNIEVTTTNKTRTEFIVKAGSEVYVEYLIKTIVQNG